MTGITDEFLRCGGYDPLTGKKRGTAREFRDVYLDFQTFCNERANGRQLVLVAHNAKFDLGFLRAEAQRCGHQLVIQEPICTLTLSRSLDPNKAHPHNLRQLAIRYGITDVPNHDALADAIVTARLLPLLLAKANITNAGELANIAVK